MRKQIYIIIFGLFFVNAVVGQLDCRVKLKTIGSTYKGKCKKGYAHGWGEAKGEQDSYIGNFKKGLPHGTGTYIWGNGNMYKGGFRKGEMDGKGVLTIKKSDEEEEVQSGYFKKGKYIGLYAVPYKVTSKREVKKVSFQDLNLNLGNYNQVKIRVNSAGNMVNAQLIVTDDNNSVTELTTGGVILTNVKFPMKKITVNFMYDNFSSRVVFDIYKKGDWDVVIHI
ncbi:hypothetical protein [Polaribacter cellanae]|uniref:MORN repeat protein n=1 Tax=Polaribacter cellanae TaxID=2818493 RepID=A0A975H793_9FLAO|nr:hypothetical protein [Polaribacter cellanae]QTE22828.1 hypothetical protein J3359_00700 [Polaribacter cellanae]